MFGIMGGATVVCWPATYRNGPNYSSPVASFETLTLLVLWACVSTAHISILFWTVGHCACMFACIATQCFRLLCKDFFCAPVLTGAVGEFHGDFVLFF
jgi:hypothetical protein